jgi:protein MpaA
VKTNSLFSILLLVPFLFSACGPTRFELIRSTPPETLPEIIPSFYEPFEIGRSVENRSIEGLVLGEGEDRILFIASIHGNETAGTPLLINLIEHIHQNPEVLDGKQLFLLPIANPDGFFRNTRYNANGIDLNRNFATSNRINNITFGEFPTSEPEARAIIQVIQHFWPHRIISLHEPLDCIDYDGPAYDLAKYLESFTNLEVDKLGARPGSLGSYTGEELGIPTITLELPREAGTLNRSELWRRYGEVLLAMIFYEPGVVVIGK